MIKNDTIKFSRFGKLLLKTEGEIKWAQKITSIRTTTKKMGRERPRQDIVQEIHKQKFTQAQTEQRIQKGEGGSKFIPGGGDAPAINETPVKDMNKDSGQATKSANSSSNT